MTGATETSYIHEDARMSEPSQSNLPEVTSALGQYVHPSTAISIAAARLDRHAVRCAAVRDAAACTSAGARHGSLGQERS